MDTMPYNVTYEGKINAAVATTLKVNGKEIIALYPAGSKITNKRKEMLIENFTKYFTIKLSDGSFFEPDNSEHKEVMEMLKNRIMRLENVTIEDQVIVKNEDNSIHSYGKSYSYSSGSSNGIKLSDIVVLNYL